MLPPNSENARCATVSPTERAMIAATADCVSGLPLDAALAFCSRLVINSRSRGLKIRSSCINVSEKASRICFAVIEHTPPLSCLGRLSSSWEIEERSGGDSSRKPRNYQTDFAVDI
jgi:hypothetical protein